MVEVVSTLGLEDQRESVIIKKDDDNYFRNAGSNFTVTVWIRYNRSSLGSTAHFTRADLENLRRAIDGILEGK